MSEIVLDASALLAMLQDEKGGNKVASVISTAQMTAVNYAEVVSHFTRLGMPGADISAMLDPLPIEVVAADKAVAHIAGELRAVTAEAGLSLGDRFCLALARRDGLPAWTADKIWKTIADASQVKVVAIR
jgi:PIN domain nuclease of toxin-antitoxin system